MSEETIQFSLEGHIATVSLNRPERRNAMDIAMWKRLLDVIEKVKSLEEVRVMILTSSLDDIFSAGADIGELEKNSEHNNLREESYLAMERGFKSINELEIPSLAVVKGSCYGAGVGLILSCDFRISLPTAKLSITPAKLGMVFPLPETRRLLNLVGPSDARHLLFSASPIQGDEALQMGLVDKVVQDDEIDETVKNLASTMAENSKCSISGIKKIFKLIDEGARDDNIEAINIFKSAYYGEDFKEGAKAFREKRKPNFK